LLPGATRSAALHACPWLLYFAPSALTLAQLTLRAFGADVGPAYIARLWR